MLDALGHLLRPLYRRFPTGWRAPVKRLYGRLLAAGIGVLRNPVQSPSELAATRHLSVVVAVHNAADDTERCLRSLERLAGYAEVVLVDDGSTDPRAARLVRDYATRNRWKMHRNARATRHSGACSVGVTLSTRPIVCLLNSDTVVTQHAFGPCVEALRADRTVMAVGPRMSAAVVGQTDTRSLHCRYLLSDAQVFRYAEILHAKAPAGAVRRISPLVSGAAFFLRRSDWERVDGFAGCRPHYGNDNDLCAKLVRDGGWLGICDGAYIHHLAERSLPGAG